LTDRNSAGEGQWSQLREQAETIASTLPPLLVAAERLASAVSLGVHGRRKAGIGESFWQFRRYQSEDPTTAIDWRQSAKTQHLYVREREWEAAEAVWLWRDGGATMRFASATGAATKIDRASVLTLALAALLIRGGERIALLGEGRGPSTSRKSLERIAHALTDANAPDAALPPDAAMGRNAQFVWIGDFLAPLGVLETTMRRIARAGLTGHLVRIVDPAEEDFPFAGRTRFEAADSDASEIFGRAETVRDAYRARFRAHGEAVAALARRLGWSCLVHRTDKRPETALVALYADLGGARAKHTLGAGQTA
jgi:uncharacterized protein (DUF58 family)